MRRDDRHRDDQTRALHNASCYGANRACICLTCIHNKRVDDPETDSMCCDLAGHERSCRDTFPCPDYEREPK